MIFGDFFCAHDMAGDRCGCSAHATESKILGNHAAPARSSEMNRFVSSRAYCILGLQRGEHGRTARFPRVNPREWDRMTDKLVVLVTCSSTKEAERIARALVDARLAACAQYRRPCVRCIAGKERSSRQESSAGAQDFARTFCKVASGSVAAQLRSARDHRNTGLRRFARVFRAGSRRAKSASASPFRLCFPLLLPFFLPHVS